MPGSLSASVSGQSNSPRSTLKLLRRARAAHDAGDAAKADRLYAELLETEPTNFDGLHGRGRLHLDCRRYDSALSLIQAALRVDAQRPEGFSTLGLVFYELRRLDHALTSFEAGLRLAPADAPLLNQRGVMLLELGRTGEALASFEHALAADPALLDALGNYGNVLLKLNRPADAIAVYDQALALAPHNAGLLTNRAIALRKLDRPQEALMSVRRALAAKPDFAQARFVDSLVRLTLGDFQGGWRTYESRWQGRNLSSQRRTFTAPLWLGEGALTGKTILLHAEQGFGDTMQFVRYAPLIAARGAKVVLEVQRELVRLISRLEGIDAVIGRGEGLPPFDLHCPLLSLPFACRTELASIPAPVPYLAAADEDAVLWRARLPQGGARILRPRIGVVWSGDPSHDNDVNRSLRLTALAPLFAVPDVDFVSLQYRIRDDDKAVLADVPNLFRFEQSFRDFADTAAVVANLDALVSIDSAVAHLTGAMGKPLLLLLPFGADFRWLRERADSPWYPTARLFRQPRFGDWESAIESVAQDLRARFALPARKLTA
jgi:tetratricopeptide (TPR) repeat protein